MRKNLCLLFSNITSLVALAINIFTVYEYSFNLISKVKSVQIKRIKYRQKQLSVITHIKMEQLISRAMRKFNVHPRGRILFSWKQQGRAVVTNQINYKKRSRVGDKAFLGTSRKFNGRRNPYFPRPFLVVLANYPCLWLTVKFW